MDNLEDYIRKHREELDRYKPRPLVWRKTSRGMGSRNVLKYKWISAAALVAVILGTAIALLRIGSGFLPPKGQESGYQSMLKVRMQLNETEIYYNNLANSLYLEVSPMLTGNPEIEKELVTDISQIDSICSEIKKDLKDNVANQDVIEALIRNYRIKITLLEEMLTVLKENTVNSEKSNGHEL